MDWSVICFRILVSTSKEYMGVVFNIPESQTEKLIGWVNLYVDCFVSAVAHLTLYIQEVFEGGGKEGGKEVSN